MNFLLKEQLDPYEFSSKRANSYELSSK